MSRNDTVRCILRCNSGTVVAIMHGSTLVSFSTNLGDTRAYHVVLPSVQAVLHHAHSCHLLLTLPSSFLLLLLSFSSLLNNFVLPLFLLLPLLLLLLLLFLPLLLLLLPLSLLSLLLRSYFILISLTHDFFCTRSGTAETCSRSYSINTGSGKGLKLRKHAERTTVSCARRTNCARATE